MDTQRQIVDWRGLKSFGWPYSRTHTWRMMEAGTFPRAFKLTDERNGHPVWKMKEVLAWFEKRGLVLNDVDTAS
jgi:predicted DNA-binding transcriptional regulator AlpA